MTGDVVAPSSKHAVLFYAHYNLVLEKKNPPTHSPLNKPQAINVCRATFRADRNCFNTIHLQYFTA